MGKRLRLEAKGFFLKKRSKKTFGNFAAALLLPLRLSIAFYGTVFRRAHRLGRVLFSSAFQ
jgi:hypothetical protein